MFRMNAVHGMDGRSRLALWLLGIAATGFGIWGVYHFFVGTYITDCGFDANGAYAKVHAPIDIGSEVWVDFYLDGRLWTYTGTSNAHGTTVVRAGFPPEHPRQLHHHVSGRTVYIDARSGGPTFVTRKFAEAHPRRTLAEVVPDASHTLSCRFDYTDPD